MRVFEKVFGVDRADDAVEGVIVDQDMRRFSLDDRVFRSC
jgi:hypothetical protein